jgi:hypothetical protein
LVEAGDAPRLTLEGIAAFYRLRATEWRPSEDLALAVLADVADDQADLLWKFILKWDGLGGGAEE